MKKETAVSGVKYELIDEVLKLYVIGAVRPMNIYALSAPITSVIGSLMDEVEKFRDQIGSVDVKQLIAADNKNAAEVMRLAYENNELSNTNRTLASTAASLQSKLNACHESDTVLRAAIAERDKLINELRNMSSTTFPSNGMIASSLKQTQDELMDTMEKLAVSEQECEELRKSVTYQRERQQMLSDANGVLLIERDEARKELEQVVKERDAARLQTPETAELIRQRDTISKDRDQWVIKHSDVCHERDAAKQDAKREQENHHIIRAEYDRTYNELHTVRGTCDKFIKYAESEDRSIWAQFAAAVIAGRQQGFESLSYGQYADSLMELYKTRFPTPCAA